MNAEELIKELQTLPDEMTSSERYAAYARGEEVDHIPFYYPPRYIINSLTSRRYCVPSQTSSPPPGVPHCMARSAGNRSGPYRSQRFCSPSRHRPPPGSTSANGGRRLPVCFCRSLDSY